MSGSLVAVNRPEALLRSSSTSSPGSAGPGAGQTRQFRVERQRKLMEAKGRGGNTSAPSGDLHALKKKCESLETEVRSLKTFQSFMNRKDSEQTTKIEELEALNLSLIEERDQLLEELARYRAVGGDGLNND